MNENTFERGQSWLEELLRLMGMPTDVSIGTDEVLEDELHACWLVINHRNLTPEQVQFIIGQRGEGIDSIQYLANTLMNIRHETAEQQAFTVEIEGYRLRRRAELFAWARQVVQKVRTTGQEVEMKSLSGAERRQIHAFLKESDDLETESRGQEPDRRLIVRLR